MAGPAIRALREIYTTVPGDAVRVAVLVEIAAAAATLARTVVKLRHLDPNLIAHHVQDPTDLRAVLGRGRWLPTMVAHVPTPAPKIRPVRRRLVRRRPAAAQGSLFPLARGEG
ncbi:MAG TPA: hypothetical protein VGD43_12260 [Micromonospora sp.]